MFGADPKRCRRGDDAGRPHDGRRFDAVAAIAAERDALRVAAGDGSVEFDFDAHLLQRARGVVRQMLWKRRQQPRPGFNENCARLARIDAAKIVAQGSPRHFGDCASHLHPGSAAADNDESEKPRAFGLILHHLRPLEGEQEPPPDFGGVGDVLESRREWRPVIVTEIGMGRAGGEHEIIVWQIDLGGVHAARLYVDAGDPRHDHPHILLRAHNGADRPGDVGG